MNSFVRAFVASVCLCSLPLPLAFSQRPGDSPGDSDDEDSETFDLNINLEDYAINEHQIQIGDLIIDKEDLKTTRGATAKLLGRPWTDGILPIEFADDVTDEQRASLFAACMEWEKAAKITCKSRDGEKRYLLVRKRKDACFSAIGMGIMPWTGKRVMNLADDGCWNQRTIMHELGHALGLIHEHQRADRNDFIKISPKNVKFAALGNFFRIFWSKERTEYDFDSIMHYSEYSFSKEPGKLVTISTRPGYEKYQRKIGSERKLSSGDQAVAAEIYGVRPL